MMASPEDSTVSGEQESDLSIDTLEEEISSEDESMSQWTPVIVLSPVVNEKKLLYESGLYSPGSADMCNEYISMSDSTICKHPRIYYPAVTDPGIEEALYGSKPPIKYTDNGQGRYLHLCSEMNLCPVRMFHKKIPTSDINISYYGVDPRGVRAMAMALQYNKTVTRFDLTDNFLDDDACYHLGEMLKSNVTLRELILTGCRIGESGLLRLGDNLHSNRTLVTLDLARNNISDAGGVVFANLISIGASVMEVNLSYNGLDQETALAIVEGFEFRNPLTHLDLSWNNFNHIPSTTKMLEQLANSELLQELNLSFNNLGGEHVADAMRDVLSIPELRVLDLSHNQLQGEAINIIVAGLINAKNLITLDLSHNPMTPHDAYSALQKMLRPRVNLQNLLMDSVSVQKSFLILLTRVSKMKCRQNFIVTYGDVLQNWTIEGPDARALLLKRAEYLGKLHKRHQVDIPLYFLRLNKEIKWPMPTDIAVDRLRADKIPLSEDFINELSLAFEGPKTRKSRTIDLQSVCEYIRRLWPDRKLPQTPPPEPEPEPEPEPQPPPRKKKGKGKRKIKI